MSRILGPETARSHQKRRDSGFYGKYMSGLGLDIGYKGSTPNAEPVLDTAIGVDTDYPEYDGVHLPFADESQDYVYASHVLEHVTNWPETLREWFRVLKVGGYLVITVPHEFLYEKKKALPSRWNADHKRFYTTSCLTFEIDWALTPNTYRVRHLRDNDDDFDYSIPPDRHSDGCYEIECVIQKIQKPSWDVI